MPSTTGAIWAALRLTLNLDAIESFLSACTSMPPLLTAVAGWFDFIAIICNTFLHRFAAACCPRFITYPRVQGRAYCTETAADCIY